MPLPHLRFLGGLLKAYAPYPDFPQTPPLVEAISPIVLADDQREVGYKTQPACVVLALLASGVTSRYSGLWFFPRRDGCYVDLINSTLVRDVFIVMRNIPFASFVIQDQFTTLASTAVIGYNPADADPPVVNVAFGTGNILSSELFGVDYRILIGGDSLSWPIGGKLYVPPGHYLYVLGTTVGGGLGRTTFRLTDPSLSTQVDT